MGLILQDIFWFERIPLGSIIKFHWNLSNSKSPRVSRTLLSILTDLNIVVVWIVLIHPLISNPSFTIVLTLQGPIFASVYLQYNNTECNRKERQNYTYKNIWYFICTINMPMALYWKTLLTYPGSEGTLWHIGLWHLSKPVKTLLPLSCLLLD